MADQYTRSVFNNVRGLNARLLYWPVLSGAGVGGVVLTTGNAAWPGAYQAMIAANDIAVEYWIAGISVYTPNQIQVWQLQIGSAAGAALLATFAIDITAATVNIPPMLVPVPIYMAANAAATARAGGAGNAKTINAHIAYMTGL